MVLRSMAFLSPSTFQVTEKSLSSLASQQRAAFPELEAARASRQSLGQAPQAQIVLQQTQYLARDIQQALPSTTYTLYRTFSRTGERNDFEDPYFLKRSRLAGAILQQFFGQGDFKDAIQDYVWDICEESNWVVPAHEPRAIDLFAAETGFFLAEALQILQDTLTEEIANRVQTEITRRIFEPYLQQYQKLDWYQNANNWNGVCNSSVAATFLLLEKDPARMIQGVRIALAGLQTFLVKAFADDGSSLEGVSYWHYGMCNFVALAELLRARSGGTIDLLSNEKVKRIAAFPAKLQLSGPNFASFADCDETFRFHAGIVVRLAQQAKEPSLLNLLVRPAKSANDWRLHMLLRDILWWNGSQPESIQLNDDRLPVGGTARLVSTTSQGVPVVLSVKAGYNAEPHNHNDIGSFLLHVSGENLLTDPGRGLYSRDYFGPKRYENVFANSYGHSVPRIDDQLQQTGKAFFGQLLEDGSTANMQGYKRVAIEFARAYSNPALTSARREYILATQGPSTGTLWLTDHFEFSVQLHKVEEAFLTWMECEVTAEGALIHGQQHDLSCIIEQPRGVKFALELLTEQSKANKKTQVLKRLSLLLPQGTVIDMSIRFVLQTSQGKLT